MYQEDHGIVHNRFYDTQIQKQVTFGKIKHFLWGFLLKFIFLIDTRDEGQWSDPKVEPIWITATKQV